MKRIAMGSLVLLVFMLAGCSGLQAKGEMAAAIDSNGAMATGYLADTPQVDPAASQPDDCTRGLLASNAAALDRYYIGATVNWFAYAFGQSSILCTAKYYAELRKSSALADEIDDRAKAGRLTAAEAAALLRQEMCWLIAVKRAKDGLPQTAP
jgi:hypothetical protein